MIHTGFYHRDPLAFDKLADKFLPDALLGVHPPLYSFSAHRQSCAGESLAIFVLKATLASLLERFRFEPIGPALDPVRISYRYNHFGIALRPVADA